MSQYKSCLTKTSAFFFSIRIQTFRLLTRGWSHTSYLFLSQLFRDVSLLTFFDDSRFRFLADNISWQWVQSFMWHSRDFHRAVFVDQCDSSWIASTRHRPSLKRTCSSSNSHTALKGQTVGYACDNCSDALSSEFENLHCCVKAAVDVNKWNYCTSQLIFELRC